MKVNSELIRELRSRHGMSQETLAEAAGLSVRTVQRLERGGLASMETAMALAAVFDTDPGALEDISLEQATLLRGIERGYRLGMTGVVLGAVGAVTGIGLEFVAGGTSAAQAGLWLGVIGLTAGGVSALLGWIVQRQRLNLPDVGARPRPSETRGS